MKGIVLVMFLALSLELLAEDEALLHDANTKPTQSLRCKEYFKDREIKIGMQQRLNALLQRNQLLIKRTPETKEAIRARILSNQVRVKNELHLTTLQISSMEENIIRSGCPGLNL